ncbi:MAG: hypothetical protein ACQEXN_08755 [Actinomycetota bacterium]
MAATLLPADALTPAEAWSVGAATATIFSGASLWAPACALCTGNCRANKVVFSDPGYDFSAEAIGTSRIYGASVVWGCCG